MCSFDFVCSELNFFDRCARSPPRLKKSSCRRGATAGKNVFEAKTAFQSQASAKQSQTFESCLSGVFEDELFPGKN